MKKLIPVALFLFPVLAFAQGLESVLVTINDLLNLIVPIIMVIAIIVFFWGLVKYLMAAGDAESKSQGLHLMVGGIIALFVMATVWGLVQVLQDTFGITEGNAPNSNDIIPR